MDSGGAILYNDSVKQSGAAAKGDFMNYKNRKRDYDLYPTVEFDDVRHMLKCTAEKYGERTAISYRVYSRAPCVITEGPY